jgi:hypothetical protein
MNIRRSIATVGATGALAAGSLFLAAPAQAAPVVTGGLVNVTIVDVLDIDDTIVSVQALNGVTVQAAALICGVSVNALAVDLGPDGVAVCDVDQDLDSTTTTTVTQRRR